MKPEFEEALKALKEKLKTHRLQRIRCPRCGFSGEVPAPSDLPLSMQRYPSPMMICPDCHGGQYEWVEKKPGDE